MDRDTLGVKDVGGKEFNFCNKLFGVNGIVMTCGKPQRLNLQPLDTYHTHAHEVHSKFFVLKEFWDADDEFQAHAHCSRKDEFYHGRSPIFSEESEDIPCVGPSHDGFDASTPLVGTFCRGLFYYKSVHTSSSVGTHRDDNWVKGFFLLMPHEEQEAPTYSIDELMVQPCGMKSTLFSFYVDKKH